MRCGKDGTVGLEGKERKRRKNKEAPQNTFSVCRRGEKKICTGRETVVRRQDAPVWNPETVSVRVFGQELRSDIMKDIVVHEMLVKTGKIHSEKMRLENLPFHCF